MSKSGLSVAGVAKVAECHRNTVLRYTERGLIRASRYLNGFRWYELSEALKLRELLNARVDERLMAGSRG
jgi:DNA-binding transcriptional MerR regulator